MVSGPAEAHDKFWESLREEVNIEDPGPLDRFLGRYHHIAQCAPPDYNIIDYFEPDVEDTVEDQDEDTQ